MGAEGGWIWASGGELPGPSMEEHNGSAETPLPSHGRHSAVKCGWLRKQGGFVKTWHTRWFVLKGDQLYYFKDEDETKPLMLVTSEEALTSMNYPLQILKYDCTHTFYAY
ncbi:hypothetical protein Q9233_000656 [Columba guinea]|nr:hypothetical protein Q9233_000656 [Columba guinea]